MRWELDYVIDLSADLANDLITEPVIVESIFKQIIKRSWVLKRTITNKIQFVSETGIARRRIRNNLNTKVK